jgi:hypothetical protein
MTRPISSGDAEGPATAYAEAVRRVGVLIAESAPVSDQARFAYMVARAALLYVRAMADAERAAEMAYSLADEFASEVRPK